MIEYKCSACEASAMAALRPLTVEERKRVLDEAGVRESERVEL